MATVAEFLTNTLGLSTDSEATGNGTAIAILKRIRTLLSSNSIVQVTLSLDAGNVYADGDVLAATQEVASAVASSGGTCVLQSVTVLDKDDQGEDMDIYLLSANVAMGTENDAASISDANAAKIQAIVPVYGVHYFDAGGCQLASLTPGDAGIGAVLSPDSGTSLYVAVVSRGTGTYTASGVVLSFAFAGRT